METSNTKSNLKENISLIDSELLEIRKRIYLLENGMNSNVSTVEHNVSRKNEQNEYGGYSPSFYETYLCQTEPSSMEKTTQQSLSMFQTLLLANTM